MQNESNILWAECQQILRDNLSQSAYQTWFAPIAVVQWSDNVLVLQVKSQFIVDYIEENYLDLLSRVLRKVFGNKVQLEYRVLIADSAINVPSAPSKAKETTYLITNSIRQVGLTYSTSSIKEKRVENCFTRILGNLHSSSTRQFVRFSLDEIIESILLV